MKRKKPVSLVFASILLFMCGFSACAGLMCFHQDLLGLEGYIDYLRRNWVNLSPWVGMTGAVINVMLAVWYYFQIKDRLPGTGPTERREGES